MQTEILSLVRSDLNTSIYTLIRYGLSQVRKIYSMKFELVKTLKALLLSRSSSVWPLF